MSRPLWLDCTHVGPGLPGCPSCDLRPVAAHDALISARDYIGHLEAENRRLQSLLDALVEQCRAALAPRGAA